MSSCAFSQLGNYFARVVPGMMLLYIRFGETKDKYFNRSLRHGTEMRHRNLRSGSVHTGSIGTGAMLVPGFGTQPYIISCNSDSIPSNCEKKSQNCEVKIHTEIVSSGGNGLP